MLSERTKLHRQQIVIKYCLHRRIQCFTLSSGTISVGINQVTQTEPNSTFSNIMAHSIKHGVSCWPSCRPNFFRYSSKSLSVHSLGSNSCITNISVKLWGIFPGSLSCQQLTKLAIDVILQKLIISAL